MAEVADGDTTRAHELLIRLWEDQTSVLGRGLLHTAPGRTDAAFQAFRDVKSWPPAVLVLTLRDWYPSLFAPFRHAEFGGGRGCAARPELRISAVCRTTRLPDGIWILMLFGVSMRFLVEKQALTGGRVHRYVRTYLNETNSLGESAMPLTLQGG